METSLVWFIVIAIVVNVVIYGGMTWAYFRDKHRVDPPKAATTPSVAAHDEASAELHRAA